MSTFDGRVQPIFNDALELSNGSERERFLALECGNDRALLARVIALIHAHEVAGEFLAERRMSDPSQAERPPLG